MQIVKRGTKGKRGFGLSSGLSPRCDPLALVPLRDHKRDWHLIV